MSAALPSPADCCNTCPPSACGTPIDIPFLVGQTLGGQLGVINVTDPQWAGGAKGDGITDDTAAIQAAIDASLASYLAQSLANDYQQGSARMMPIYFPQALDSYLISDRLRFNVDKLGGLSILGLNARIVQQTAGKSIFSFEGSIQQNVQIRGFVFDYQSPQTDPASNCISFEGGPPGYQGEPQYRHFLIEECQFKDCYTAIKKQDNGANYCTVWGCTFRNLRIWYHYGSGIDLYSVSLNGNPNNLLENIHAIGSRQTLPLLKFRVEQNLILRNIELNAGTNTQFCFVVGGREVTMENTKMESGTYNASANLVEFQESTNVEIRGFSCDSAVITNGTFRIFKFQNHGGLGPVVNTYRVQGIEVNYCNRTAPGGFYVVTLDQLGGMCPTIIDPPFFFNNVGIDNGNLVDFSADAYRSITVAPESRASQLVLQDSDFGHTWATGVSYAVGACIEPTVPNGHFYLCTVAGVSGALEPVWPIAGGTVTDGGATWTDTVLTTSAYQLDINSAPLVTVSGGITADRTLILPVLDITKNIIYAGFKLRIVRDDAGLNDLLIWAIGINAAPPPVYTFAALLTLAAGSKASFEVEYTPGISGYWLVTGKGTL